MDNAVVKNVIKYVKTHFEPLTSEELAKAIGVGAEDAKEAIGKLAYLGIVEVDERDGRVFSAYESDFIVKGGSLVKYIGNEERVVIPEWIETIGANRNIASDVEYGVPGVWNWAESVPQEIVIPSTSVKIAEDAFLDLPNDVVITYTNAFSDFCKELCSDKYLLHFSDNSAEYMCSDGITQPYYVGTAKAFCDFFSEKYNELYFILGFESSPVKDELDRAYGEYDYILQGDDLPGKEAIDKMTVVEIVAVISILFDMEQLNTGYIAWCGRCGFISALLGRLKNTLSEEYK
jgi:hypothetical protein